MGRGRQAALPIIISRCRLLVEPDVTRLAQRDVVIRVEAVRHQIHDTPAIPIQPGDGLGVGVVVGPLCGPLCAMRARLVYCTATHLPNTLVRTFVSNDFRPLRHSRVAMSP